MKKSDAVPGIEYSVLGNDGRRKILTERIGSLEAEYFNHSLNLRLAEETGVEEIAETSAEMMSTISIALSVLREEMDKLGLD